LQEKFIDGYANEKKFMPGTKKSYLSSLVNFSNTIADSGRCFVASLRLGLQQVPLSSIGLIPPAEQTISDTIVIWLLKPIFEC